MNRRRQSQGESDAGNGAGGEVETGTDVDTERKGGEGGESVPAPRVVLGAGLKAWCAEGFGRTAQRIGQGGNKS